MTIQQRNKAQTSDSSIQKQSEDMGSQSQDTDRLLPNQSDKLILSWNEIPAWMQDNVYITGGYRRQTNSYWECVAATWNRCDYAGITCLIVGSFFPVIYYGFHCHHILQVVYLSIIVSLGSVTAAVTLMKHFRTPAYRWVRASLFMALGLFGLIPTFHGIWIYGLTNATKTIALGHMALMATTYITGALIYGCRFPERIMPGKFNLFGASHQIFHICVTIAVLAHYFGVMSAMAFWHDVSNEEFCQALFF
ncbi:hypothetical protein [Parasitella parasitica]|uniref:Uncharacterized protein n=1 Tax=Parasitella parasitica TaxID=35722 RepID=A0A0B7ND95_9FUNG|nr:hypothetical protein [Parasitella parasitica]